MRAVLLIEAEFDSEKLDWQGTPPPDNLVEAYNKFYKQNPWEAFEIALKDENFRVVKATIKEV